MAPTTAARLALIEAALARIEAALSARVPVAAIEQAIEDTSATADAVAGIATAIDAQMTDDELRKELRDSLFYVRQFTSVLQGTRDEVVQMRADFRRLAALLEQTLHVRVEDEERGIVWRAGDADRRKAS